MNSYIYFRLCGFGPTSRINVSIYDSSSYPSPNRVIRASLGATLRRAVVSISEAGTAAPIPVAVARDAITLDTQHSHIVRRHAVGTTLPAPDPAQVKPALGAVGPTTGTNCGMHLRPPRATCRPCAARKINYPQVAEAVNSNQRQPCPFARPRKAAQATIGNPAPEYGLLRAAALRVGAR